MQVAANSEDAWLHTHNYLRVSSIERAIPAARPLQRWTSGSVIAVSIAVFVALSARSVLVEVPREGKTRRAS